MKLNFYQKIILLIYSCLFVYFSIIHVPFKANYQRAIEYDTLFSNRSNLDIGRFVLILVVISILSFILFLLVRSIANPKKALLGKVIKICIYSISAIGLILISFWGISKFNEKKSEPLPIVNTPRVDTTIAVIDSTSSAENNPYLLKKIEPCTEQQALRDFKSYMKFYYPDWKIYGSPVVKENSDCTYRVQFTTMDPHIKFDREVIVVEISYNYDHTKYYFSTVRGTLY